MPVVWPRDRNELFILGLRRVEAFCALNGLVRPAVHAVLRREWSVSACAYYRPDTPRTRKWLSTPGINLCIELCQVPCGDAATRNWSWPASAVDREPYGVLAHELGHHVDWLAGERKGAYYSEVCELVKTEAQEPGLTGYANENPAEWFAEAFRLYVTNHSLLRALRPRTHAALKRRWQALGPDDWLPPLGSNVPERVVKSLVNKGARKR